MTRSREFEKFAVGGLLAAEMASILAILAVSPLSASLKTAVICFSYSIPVLGVFMLKDVFTDSYKPKGLPMIAGPIFGWATKAGLLGIACLFFHVWWCSGVIFCIMTVIVWWLLITETDGKTDWDDPPKSEIPESAKIPKP